MHAVRAATDAPARPLSISCARRQQTSVTQAPGAENLQGARAGLGGAGNMCGMAAKAEARGALGSARVPDVCTAGDATAASIAAWDRERAGTDTPSDAPARAGAASASARCASRLGIFPASTASAAFITSIIAFSA